MSAAPQQALTYEQEQTALLRQQESSDIRINAPREPEVNPDVYRDVIPILFRGFLTMPASIGEAHFVFKSLNHHEFEILQLMAPMEKTNAYKYWDQFLAYNVFLIDGQNVLSDRERWLPKIADMFAQIDPKPKKRIIRYVSEINRRANNAVIMSDCYATESYSRHRWAQLQGLDLCSPTVTGISGTEMLGMNWAQLTWRAINHYEDRNEQSEREWENTKFVGSCMAGKGMQKIYQQDSDRRRKDKEERFARKDEIFREVIMGEKRIDGQKQLNGAIVTAAHTVEELGTQLEKDLKGEKDWHDRVIEEHTDRIKRNVQARQDQVRELSKHHEVEFAGQKLLGGTNYGDDFKGLSSAEVQERVTRSKQLDAQRAAQRMVRPDVVVTDEKSAQFMEKWKITDSNVTVKIDRTTQDSASSAAPIVSPRQGGGSTFGRR